MDIDVTRAVAGGSSKTRATKTITAADYAAAAQTLTDNATEMAAVVLACADDWRYMPVIADVTGRAPVDPHTAAEAMQQLTDDGDVDGR